MENSVIFISAQFNSIVTQNYFSSSPRAEGTHLQLTEMKFAGYDPEGARKFRNPGFSTSHRPPFKKNKVKLGRETPVERPAKLCRGHFSRTLAIIKKVLALLPQIHWPVDSSPDVEFHRQWWIASLTKLRCGHLSLGSYRLPHIHSLSNDGSWRKSPCLAACLKTEQYKFILTIECRLPLDFQDGQTDHFSCFRASSSTRYPHKKQWFVLLGSVRLRSPTSFALTPKLPWNISPHIFLARWWKRYL